MFPVDISGSILLEAAAILAGAFAPLNLPKPSAVVLALLYLFGKPLDCTELQKFTGYSRSAISAALRVLESHRLVHKVKRGRRSAYSASMPLVKLVTEAHLRALRSVRERLGEFSGRLPELRESVGRLDSELARAIRVLEVGLHGAEGKGSLE